MRQFLRNGSRILLRPQTNILSAAFIIMVTYGLSHLVGLLKTRLLISYFFGDTAHLLDVYYAAFVIPDTVFQLLVIGSLSAAFIPVFTKLLEKSDSDAWRMASSTLNFTLVIFTLFSAGIYILSPQLAAVLAPGFTPGQLAILSQLMRIMLAAQLFFCVSGFLTATIQSHQRFVIPALAPLAYSLGIIAGIVFLSPSMGIFGPAIGTVFGALVHMAIQIPTALRLGFRPRLKFDIQHPGVREVMGLFPHRAVALGVDQVEHVVTVVLASLLAAGSLSIFNVARLLYVLPSSLFGVTLGQAALPTLSRQSSDSERKQFSHTLVEVILQVAFLAVPVSVLFIVLRIPIVRLVFGASSFPWTATLLTGKTLAILSLSATFAACQQLIARAFFALHDTRTPLQIGLVAALIHIVLAITAINILGWGVVGLAGVLSAVTIFETLLLFTSLTHRLNLKLSLLLFPLVKILIAGSITGICLWLPMRLLDRFVFDTTRTIPLIGLTVITSFIGLVTYILLSYFFHVDELTAFLKLARRVAAWPKTLIVLRSSEPLIPDSDQP